MTQRNNDFLKVDGVEDDQPDGLAMMGMAMLLDARRRSVLTPLLVVGVFPFWLLFLIHLVRVVF